MNLLMDTATLAAQIEQPDVVVFDTRTAEEYAQGHIPNAIHLPDVYDHLVTDTRPAGVEAFHRFLTDTFSAAGLTGNERVVFYEKGTGMRAARGVWLLEYAGHFHVAMLHGGLAGWTATGHPLSTEPSQRERRSFPLRPRPEMVATADDVHERLERKNVIILDVRRHDEYTGAFLQECCARFGRIPGAVWLEWDRLLDETTYKSLDAMKAELESVGATPDKEIVPYCHRGARSSNTYIALKLLGYPNVRNYVGSWHEWSHRTELPMECGEG